MKSIPFLTSCIHHCELILLLTLSFPNWKIQHILRYNASIFPLIPFLSIYSNIPHLLHLPLSYPARLIQQNLPSRDITHQRRVNQLLPGGYSQYSPYLILHKQRYHHAPPFDHHSGIGSDHFDNSHSIRSTAAILPGSLP